MRTPLIRLLASLLLTDLPALHARASDPGSSPDLQLVATARETEYRSFVVQNGLIVVRTEAGGVQPLPHHVQWHMEGDLRAVPHLIDFSPRYDIWSPPHAADVVAPEPRWDARIWIRSVRRNGRWREQDLRGAIAIVVWLVNGQITQVEAQPVITGVDLFAAMAISLNAAEKHGVPVTLLHRDGKFASPERWFREAAAEEALASLVWNDPVAFAEALSALRSVRMRGTGQATLLHMAAETRRLWAIEALLQRGADPRARTDTDRTPLEWAIRFGGVACIARLHDRPDLARISDSRMLAWANEAITKSALDEARHFFVAGNLWRKDPTTTSRFVGSATQFGRTDILHEIIAHGVTPLGQVDGITVTAAVARGHHASLELLLSHGGRPALPADTWTPLHEAARRNSCGLVELLLAAGANPNEPDERGVSPFLTAARYSDSAIVEAMLAGGAEDRADKRGFSALHHAVTGRRTANVALLLMRGFRPTALDREHRSALDLALELQAEPEADLLIAAEAIFDPTREEADRSIVGAIAMDRVDLLERARAHGWDPRKPLHYAWSSTTAARLYGAHRVEAWLAALPADPPELAARRRPEPPMASRERITALPHAIPGNPFPRDPRVAGHSPDVGPFRITVLVDRAGRTWFPRIEGDPPPALKTALLDALAVWKFQPANAGEATVNFDCTLGITFPSPTDRVFELHEVDSPPRLIDSVAAEPPPLRQERQTYQLRAESLSPPPGQNEGVPLRAINDPPPPRYQVREELMTVTTAQAADAVVSLVVEGDGTVRECYAISATDETYRDNVLRAVRSGRYLPAMKDGRPVRTRIVKTFQYVLAR